MNMLSEQSQHAIELIAHQLLTQRQWGRAEALYSLLLVLRPDDARVRGALAFAMLERNNPLGALEVLAPIAKQSKPLVHLLRARALHAIGEYEEAGGAIRLYAARLRRAAMGREASKPASEPAAAKRTPLMALLRRKPAAA